MQKLIYLLLLHFFFLPLAAQNHGDGPMQKLPKGVKEAVYFIREPEGLSKISPRVEPLNWWVGMQVPELEILIYAKDAASASSALIEHPGVSVTYLKRLENPNYLFLGLQIAPEAEPGSFPVFLYNERGQEVFRFDYRLEATPRAARANSPDASASLGPQDLIYLIMPDRFANGDTQNDSVEGMAQTGVDRDKFLFRHGGDLLGVIERLDYLKDLGVTAIWLNPVLENDQPYESYHGYAVSDHYRIDRRLGSNDQYKLLVQLAHERGIKVVMDVIFNHVGDQHYQMQDIPSKDWIHQWPTYTQTTYRATTLLDPYASEHDRKLMTDGWFDKHMPDLNQQNPHLARYLIQNSIWWTAFSGQDAFRIDTYAYPDPQFMADWNKRMQLEFPALGIFGETWVHGPAVQAWFTGSENLHPPFNTHLPAVTDFQLYYAINEALSKEPGWTEGVLRLYYTLAQDYLYQQPEKNVVFLDNHDLARFFTVVGEDLDQFKSGLALLLSMRGTPMLYYGTELGFTGAGGGFGEGGRVDFPGGWRKDKTNLFKEKDRNSQQQAIFSYVQRLATYRKNHPVMWSGSFTQFVPKDGLYCYSRQLDNQRMVVFFNGHNSPKTFDLTPYQSVIGQPTKAYDLCRDQDSKLGTSLDLKAKETRILILE